MSEKPKPTGEWTVFGTSVKRVGDDDSLFHCSTRTDADVAVRTYNAALAAEREKHEVLRIDYSKAIKELEVQDATIRKHEELALRGH
jgi:hypothetical protein